MAYDKVVDSARLDGALTATADAIRDKTGGVDNIQWDADTGFASAVDAITTGGKPVQPKEVNFYDCDGALLYAYTVAEAQAMIALPEGPSHEGLVFQGWNWSLEGVKALTRPMDIGATHITADGKTRLYITLYDGRTSPRLLIGLNGTASVDWGDGTEPDVVTGTNVRAITYTPAHKYLHSGDYVITLSIDGDAWIQGSLTSDANVSKNIEPTYKRALKKIEIGECVSAVNGYAFRDHGLLEEIVIPQSVQTIGANAFQDCHNLKAVIVPESVITLQGSTFAYCYSLLVVCLPEYVKELNGTFSVLGGISEVTIPESVAKIGSMLFYSCSDLVRATIPAGVTQIGENSFNRCASLVNVTILGNVTTIAGYAFNECVGLACVDFTRCIAVPTLENINAFTNIPSDCEIMVPAALHEEWIAATNWATYADNIKAY